MKREWIILLLIFSLHLFLRFYQIETRNPFGWDQVDNAWAAKNIIVEHRWPLLGMQAKLNSGFYIGPAYYYLVAVVYFLTRLDPIASGIFAGITSIFTFFIIFLITKKLFSVQVALIAIFIHTFSFYIIYFDRVQWPVNFIAPISLIIFYALYKIINGREKYIFLLALALGFSFHLHFTAVFFPLMVFLALPFFPRKKVLLKYGLASLPLFLIWLVPNFLAQISNQGAQADNLLNYLKTYYHGFHLVRVFQLAKDAFIEFEGILMEGIGPLMAIKPIKYVLLPLFFLTYYFSKPSRSKFALGYLAGLWIVVPWLVFSVYRGEISNYYFSLTRPIVIIILAYLTSRLWQAKALLLRLTVVIFWLFYSLANTQNFLRFQYHPGLVYQKALVREAIRKREVIEYKQGIPESYLYYFYTRK